MRCSECEIKGDRHRVREGGMTRTLMGITPGYYDENDNYVPPNDPNKTTIECECSNGHKWQEPI